MIEDRELRELFRAESAEHLQGLDSLLLRLEANPADKDALMEALREAHSLKGSSRMLGVKGVELLAGKIEDLLGTFKKNADQLAPGHFDRIYAGLDCIKSLVREATTGEPAGIDAASAIRLMDTAGEKEEVPPQSAAAAPVDPHTQQAVLPRQESQGWRRTDNVINTIRVDTKRLDELMTHAGELSVMKTRLEHLLTRASSLMELWEELEKGSVASGGRAPDTRTRGLVTRLGAELAGLRDEIYTDSSRLGYIADELDVGIRDARLLPFSTVLNLFPRMVRDMAHARSKEALLETEGEETRADKRIIEEMKDPLMHIIRNAIDHGIETPEERERSAKPRCGKIRVSVRKTDMNIMITVADDGKGLDLEAIRRTAAKRKILTEDELAQAKQDELYSLVFYPGFSTSEFVTDISGRGIGLDVVRTNVELLKGIVQARSAPGAGCTISITLPITLSTTRVVIALVNGRNYAIPVEFVHTTRFVNKKDIVLIKGKEAVLVGNEAVPVARLSAFLELPQEPDATRLSQHAQSPCVIFTVGNERFGALADALVDEQEVVLKPQSSLLKRVRNVSGATILGNGEVCMVLNPVDMIKTLARRPLEPLAATVAADDKKKLAVLLAEDSITTRTQEKRILESAGYEVVTAVDGVDALGKLALRKFDAVISDVLMPGMDGLTLTSRIREDKRYRDMPVILVTTLASDEDKRRGLEAGANAYIPKPAFDQKLLIEILNRLI